jgi:hypothetical protein
LEKPSQYKENFFGCLAHGKCLVRSIPMQEKSLEKEREIPMRHKKNKYFFHLLS